MKILLFNNSISKTLLSIKRIAFLVLLLTATLELYAQHVTGKIVDSNTKKGLADVHIINLQDSTITFSKKNGSFSVSSYGNYKLSRLGYQSKIYAIDTDTLIVIQLDAVSTELNEIVVQANRIPIALKKATSTINLVSEREIKKNNTIDFSPILNNVPGIYMQSGALNTNRITIRGIGSRNLYGTAKIRAYLKDIPLTSGNGETSIEDLDLETISRMEIIKGAISSVYGAGLGGAIHLFPKDPYKNQTDLSSNFAVGSFGLWKSFINLNHGSLKNGFRFTLNKTHLDGYRENSEYNRIATTFLSDHKLSNIDELTTLIGYSDMKAYIPSSIDQTIYLNEPTQAAFTWKSAKGFEDMKRIMLGVSWQHHFSDNLKQITSIFSSYRDAYEARPFDILLDNTFASGIRSRLLKYGKKINWTFGSEFFFDSYAYETFENLYQDFPMGTGSVSGSKLSDFNENRIYVNFFAESTIDINAKTMLSTGFNINKTSYKIKDSFITDTKPDQSGNYTFKTVFSPRLGISYQLTKTMSLYTSVSHGFSPPTMAETLLPNGQINPEIQPEQGWNLEVGSRGSFIDKKLLYNLALYRMVVNDLLVARRTGQDQYVGINAGKSLHKGFELSLNYTFNQNGFIRFKTFFTGTFNDFIFKDFVDGENDYSGNELTGVPSTIINTGLDFETKSGFYATFNYNYTGAFPMNDANTIYTDSYQLVNLKMGYKHMFNEKFGLDVFLGINNVFDEKYASQILINAIAFGANQPRYYYPGNPVNYYSGIRMEYNFD